MNLADAVRAAIPVAPISLDPSLPVGLTAVLGAGLVAFTVWRMLRTTGRGAFSRWALRLVMVLLAIVVVVRPIIPVEQRAPVATGGLEVYFVVDTTTSMAAEDVGGETVGRPATRLDGARADIERISGLLTGAQFSLTTFDAAAVQRVPLTSDQSAVLSASRTLTPEISGYSRGSSIDEALPLLTEILRDAKVEHPSAKRVLFYLGDGEQTRAQQVPASFAALGPYLSGGAVLGYGTASGGPMRINDSGRSEIDPSDLPYLADPSTGLTAISKIDELALGTISAQLGVQYVHRQAGEPVDPVVSGIDVGKISTTPGSSPSPGELYWIAAIALGLLLTIDMLRAIVTLANLRRPTQTVRS